MPTSQQSRHSLPDEHALNKFLITLLNLTFPILLLDFPVGRHFDRDASGAARTKEGVHGGTRPFLPSSEWIVVIDGYGRPVLFPDVALVARIDRHSSSHLHDSRHLTLEAIDLPLHMVPQEPTVGWI